MATTRIWTQRKSQSVTRWLATWTVTLLCALGTSRAQSLTPTAPMEAGTSAAASSASAPAYSVRLGAGEAILVERLQSGRAPAPLLLSAVLRTDQVYYAAYDDGILVIDVRDRDKPQIVQDLTGVPGIVQLNRSADGKWLAAVDTRGEVHRFDRSDPLRLRLVPRPAAVAPASSETRTSFNRDLGGWSEVEANRKARSKSIGRKIGGGLLIGGAVPLLVLGTVGLILGSQRGNCNDLSSEQQGACEGLGTGFLVIGGVSTAAGLGMAIGGGFLLK